MNSLDDKIAIVTGASRGIGEATARELARRGAIVVLAARSSDALVRLVDEIRAEGAEGMPLTTDVARPDEIERLVARVSERFGGVDIVVNNAGMAPEPRQIYDYGVDEWEYSMAVNVRAAWYLSKLAHPIMRDRGGGVIVNVSSVGGLQAEIGNGLYGVAKAGLVFLTAVCAKEWARDNIRVNCVAPGTVRTSMSMQTIDYLRSRDRPPNPLNMIGEPEDVARLISFLVGEESRYITGDVIRIDGGLLM